MRTVRGWTTIELLTVAAIFVIASAVTLPHLDSPATTARTATLEGLAGSIRSGAALAHSLWRTDRTSPAIVTVGNVPVAMDPFTGYPAASDAGIGHVLPNLRGFTTAALGARGYRFNLVGALPASCGVSYTLASARGEPPSVGIGPGACR